MLLKNETLNVVLAGDWNRLYMQPTWMAEKVFEKDEIEIGVKGFGIDVQVSYRESEITITPSQSRVIFSVANTNDEAIGRLCECLNNFVQNAYTPQPISYGFNVEFEEENGILFAEVLDSMSDSNTIIENGYTIASTQVSRVLMNNGRVIKMDSNLENANLNIRFNQEHTDEENPNFCIDQVNAFLTECETILSGLGYDLEEVL